jgi:hypothetical protein
MTVAPTPVSGPRHPHARRLASLVAAAVLGGLVVALLVHYGAFGSSSTSSTEQGSGTAATQVRQLPPFSAVELTGSNVVTVDVGGRQSVVVHADSNLLDNITTSVTNGRLLVGNRGSFATKSPTSVAVTVPTLSAVTLSGSGVVAVETIRGQSLTLALPGSGVLRAGGSVGRLDVTLAGSGDAQLGDLAAQQVHAVVSGSGRIVVNPTSALDASVSGSGVIVYLGSPTHLTTSVTGSGAITHG